MKDNQLETNEKTYIEASNSISNGVQSYYEHIPHKTRKNYTRQEWVPPR